MTINISYKGFIILLIAIGSGIWWVNTQDNEQAVVHQNIENKASVQVSTESTESVSVFRPQEQVQQQQASNPTYFSIEPTMDKNMLPMGVVLTFPQAQNAYKKDTPIDLSGIVLEPPLPFSGYWQSSQQFVIQWQRPEADTSDVAVMVRSLPGKTKPIVIDVKNMGPHVVKTPSWQLNAFVLESFSPKQYAKMKMVWNVDFPVNILKKSIVFRVQRTTQAIWEEVPANRIEVVKDMNHNFLITIRDRTLKGGEKLGFVFVHGENIDGRKVQSNVAQYITLQLPTKIEIGHITATEGSDFFAINVPFYVRGQRNQYVSYQPRIDAMLAKPFVQVSPDVDFEVVPGLGNFRLVGAFKPKTKYEITLLPGLKGTKHEYLAQKVTKIVQTPSFKPTLSFLNKARYMPKLDGAEIAFEYRNVDAMSVVVKRVPPQNLVFWMAQNQTTDAVAEQVFKTQLKLEMKADKKVRGSIGLSEMTSAGKGVYEVLLYQRHKNNAEVFTDSAMIVVTDLAAIAKRDAADLYIWTRTAKNFTAKGNVRVKVMSFNNFEIASCTTNDEGACILKGVMKQPKKPYALILSTDDDLSYMRFSDVVLSNGDAQENLRAYGMNKTALEAYIYASRGVYRPGETVNLAAVVWSGERKSAKGVPLHWKVLSPRQKVVKEVHVRSSDFGVTSLNVKLDDYAGTGKYQVVLSSGEKQLNTYGFFVEEFVPERIGLKVSSKVKQYTVAEDIKFDVDAKYLFGPPVAEGSYKARFSLKPAWFTVPGHKNFSTGEYSLNTQAAMVLQPIEGKLDKDGLAQLNISVQGMESAFPTVMKLVSNVDVTESGSGRVTHRSASVLVSAYDKIIGLRNIEAKGGNINFEGKLFTPQGQDVKQDAKIQLSLYQIYSNWTYAWNPRLGYNTWQSEDILMREGDITIVDMKQGHFEAQLHTQMAWGRYVVRAQAVDSKQVSDLVVAMGYSWGRNVSGNKPRSPDQIELIASVKEAHVGDDVTFNFDSPFAGQALFALEAETVLESQWTAVKKGHNSITIQTPDFLPNVYASLLVIKDPKEGHMYVPARAWGSASLKVIPQDFILNVSTTVPDTMRPGNDLVIQLNSNNAKSTEYTVAVVDQGILQLTRFQTPKPLDYFFEPRRLGVSTFETIGWTFPRNMAKKQGQIGGGADAAKNATGRVMPVRLVSSWSGVVQSDAQGKAEVRVPIPSFQGKVRVMVVAAQDGKVGHSEKFVTVRDPLVMQPTLPRFLQWGDSFEIPVFVVNMTGKTQKVKATVSASQSVLLKQTTQVVEIADMQSATLFFPVEVQAFDGKASFQFKVEAGDIETKDSSTLPIIPLSPEQTTHLVLPTDKSFKLADYIPDNLRDNGLKVRFAVSALPYISELKRLGYLIRYPYGCIEQTTSSTMPLLYVEKVLAATNPEALQGKNITDMVYRGLNRLLSMQTISGGFAYWPGGAEPVLWGTAYATHLLLKAKEEGYDVPQHALQDALTFMEEALTTRQYQWRNQRYYYTDAEPYMVFVLGLAGKHQKSLIRKLAKQGSWRGGRVLENRFLIMLAAHMAGEKQLAEQMMKDYNLLSIVDAKGRDYNGSYWSSSRTDAMRLSLAEDVWPNDSRLHALTQKVAKKLAHARYLNTQEVAWSVSALGKIASRYQGASIEGIGLKVGKKILPPSSQDKQVTGWHFYNTQVPLDKSLSLQFKGDKAPFLYATVSGYSKSLAALTTSTSLAIKRDYLSLQGKPIDITHIKQGQLLVVRLSLSNHSGNTLDNIAVSDRIPVGFEIENTNLGRNDAMPWIDEKMVFKPEYVDRKDDRINIFGSVPRASQAARSLQYHYIVRAVSVGDFTAAPAKIEAMYEPEKHAYSGYDKVSIQKP